MDLVLGRGWAHAKESVPGSGGRGGLATRSKWQCRPAARGVPSRAGQLATPERQSDTASTPTDGFGAGQGLGTCQGVCGCKGGPRQARNQVEVAVPWGGLLHYTVPFCTPQHKPALANAARASISSCDSLPSLACSAHAMPWDSDSHVRMWCKRTARWWL